ncbi:GlpM family protein [Ectobacillus polymachus]|uniref:GlpM family protein n=1 Tax=Ectobacillus polymachus TaxID=1508806 RepID=UPI003A897D77
MVFDYVIKFVLGGTILVLATYLSKSKHLFLSGIITLLPIMTLMNMRLQMKFMDIKEFRITQKFAIFGALGAVILVFSVYILSNWIKPTQAAIISLMVYIMYMFLCKHFL